MSLLTRPRPARRTPPNAIAFVAALGWLAVILVPVYYLLATTLRTRESYLDGHPLAFPEDPTLDSTESSDTEG